MSIPTRSSLLQFTRSSHERACIALIVLTSLFIVHALEHVAGFLPSCPIYRFTGMYCPGCGITRGLFLLSDGHPLLAAAMNPLLAAALLMGAFLFVTDSFRNRRTAMLLNSPLFLRTAIVLVVLFTVARNLPWEPFRLLAPGAMLGH